MGRDRDREAAPELDDSYVERRVAKAVPARYDPRHLKDKETRR
jgi:hypothetical protein